MTQLPSPTAIKLFNTKVQPKNIEVFGLNKGVFMNKYLVLFLFFGLTACHSNLQNPQSDTLYKSSSEDQNFALSARETPTLIVTNIKGEALAGAQVLFGTRFGQPFVNNLIETNREGQVTAPKEWDGPISITVNSPGYLRVTYLNVTPKDLIFKLRPLEKAERIEMSGITNGFGSLEKNNIADFGLVIQALNKRDLFSFSLDKIISSEMDIMSIAGFDAKVPSNLTFPKQKESYVIPVTLEKERYRFYFNEPGSKKVYALHGKFPFTDVVDKIRNKVPFPMLINYFEFTNASLRDVIIAGPTVINLPVSDLSFTEEETVIPPKVNADNYILTIALMENQGYLYPTDLHKVENSNPIRLKGLFNSSRYLLSMLKRNEANKTKSNFSDALSLELVPHRHNQTPNFLNLLAAPQPTKNGWNSIPPTIKGDITPLSTYSVLSTVYNNPKQKTSIRQWEFYSDSWNENLEIPEWPNENSLSETTPTSSNGELHRWEVTYTGTNKKQILATQIPMGPDVINYTTHMSFNSVEF